MALYNCYSVLARQDLLFTCRDSISSPKKRASGYYCKYLSAIKRSDQKLWRFSGVIRVSRDKTSSSTSRDSIGSPRKRASGINFKYLSVIQRSDQKLWRFSAVIPVWRHKTSSYTSRDSMVVQGNGPLETTVNI